MINFAKNLDKIEKKINDYNQGIKKNRRINIIAVSKTFGQERVLSALNSGFYCFGENKVQEAKLKFNDLIIKFPKIHLHMIGRLQTNKVKDALKIFHTIQTLDREKLGLEIKKTLSAISLTKSFFIQVNIADEPQKSGISIQDSDDFINWCKNDLLLNIIGLMCIPPYNEDSETYFMQLKEIAIRNNIENLSMGMSSDYINAIRCGATHIRLGEALFGKR